MSRQKEIDLESLPKGPFTLIPGVGIVKVIREKVPIFEHTGRRRGFPCPELYGLEVELLKGGEFELVCRRCFRSGVIETPSNEQD